MTLAQQLPLLVAAVFVVGTPHGALDGRIGRALLEPRLGAAWLGWFVGAYLLLAAAVVVRG